MADEKLSDIATNNVPLADTDRFYTAKSTTSGFVLFSDLTSVLQKTITSENLQSSDATGSDGATNRVLTATSTPLFVVLERQFLHPTTDFTVSGSNITFLVPLFNVARVTVWGTT